MGMLTKLIKIVILILSLTLGFFFMFVGILKLTPAVKEDTHEEMVSVIILIRTTEKYNSVFNLDFENRPIFNEVMCTAIKIGVYFFWHTLTHSLLHVTGCGW